MSQPPIHREPASVSVGIAGLGREGLYHLQRLSLRTDLCVVAVFDYESSATANRFDCSRYENWHEFINDSSLEVIILTAALPDRARLANEALRAGKHIVTDCAVGLFASEIETLVATARQMERSFSVINSRRQDFDFISAREVARSGEIGDLVSAKIIEWDYGLYEPTTSNRSSSIRTEQNRCTDLWHFAAIYFDQLLQIVADEPSSVYARSLDPWTAEGELNGFLAIVQFSSGANGQIEVHVKSPTPYHSGWLISGSKGGYRDGKRYALTDETEIFATDRNQSSVDKTDEFYAAVVDHACNNRPWLNSATEAHKVALLIEASQKSMKTGQAIQRGNTTDVLVPE